MRLRFLRPVPVLVALALLLGGAREATADSILLNPSADTYITQHANLGGPDSNHAGDPLLYAIRGTTSSTLAFPLLRFDLTPFAGRTVTGPATLELFTSTFFPQDLPRTVSVHPVLIPWSASLVTFNNFSPLGPGVHFGSDVGAALDIRSFLLNGANPPRYITWSIPASLLQQWIDNPASNNGLLMNNQIVADRFDVTFHAMENVNSPRLTFQTGAIPEPGTLSLLLVGTLTTGAGFLRRRGA